MAFPGFASTPAPAPGLTVPCPNFDQCWWFYGLSAPVDPRLVVYDKLACTVRTIQEEGGRATAAIAIQEDGVPGVQVQITMEGVWDVVLVDSFEDSLCPGVNPFDPLDEVTRVFVGRGDAGSILRLNRGPQELGATLEGFLRPNVIAPGGIGARCLYENLYLAVEGNTGGLVRLTPVVDGERVTAETVTFAVPANGTDREVRRFEIALGRKSAQSRYGLVGTWFTFEAEVLDAFGCGWLEFAGAELQYALLEESVPGQVFTGESLTTPLSAPAHRWFMGAAGSLLRGDDGVTDGGAGVAVRLRTNEIAWAGVGGEALYENVYLALSRYNALPWTIRVTPIVDDVPQSTVQVTLAGVTNPVTEVVEVSLAQLAPRGTSTYWPRGCWLALLIEADTAPDREVIFEGWSPFAATLTESLGHVDA